MSVAMKPNYNKNGDHIGHDISTSYYNSEDVSQRQTGTFAVISLITYSLKCTLTLQ